jgi:hypothetical protein
MLSFLGPTRRTWSLADSSFFFAIRESVDSSNVEYGVRSKWFDLSCRPATGKIYADEVVYVPIFPDTLVFACKKSELARYGMTYTVVSFAELEEIKSVRIHQNEYIQKWKNHGYAMLLPTCVTKRQCMIKSVPSSPIYD